MLFVLSGFFNVAFAYKDMLEKSVCKNFNIDNHSQNNFWLMGCCGPFYVIDMDLPGKMVYPILKLDNELHPK